MLSDDRLLAFGASWVLGLVMLLTAGIYDGPLAEPALVLVLGVVAVTAWRFGALIARGRTAGTGNGARTPRRTGLGAAAGVTLSLATFAVMALFDRRLLTDARRATWPVEVALGVAVTVVLTYLVPVASARLRDARFVVLAVVMAAAGIAVVSISPSPHIDVWSIHTTGAQALAHGKDPYEVVSVPDTGPVGIPLSFVYPPGTLYACLLGWLAGDVRYAMLAALIATGFALRSLARAPAGTSSLSVLEDAPALVVWLSPKTLFFVEQSWNDVLPLAFTALAVLARSRERRVLAGVLLGVALSTKQSMFWVIPLAVLLDLDRRAWMAMFAVGAAIVVPFAAWDFRALKHANLDYHSSLPPRFDGLTPMNFLYRHFGVFPRSWPGFVLAAATSALAVGRAPRTPFAFATSATLAFLAFFVFNKWAFMNYYFFLAGLAALASATARRT